MRLPGHHFSWTDFSETMSKKWIRMWQQTANDLFAPERYRVWWSAVKILRIMHAQCVFPLMSRWTVACIWNISCYSEENANEQYACKKYNFTQVIRIYDTLSGHVILVFFKLTLTGAHCIFFSTWQHKLSCWTFYSQCNQC